MGRRVNQYGLNRHVSAEVARTVRQEAGFGCVLCGDAFYTMEHIDPLWVDAREHDPDRMTLLCIGCQGKVTKQHISKETVWAAKGKPRCLQDGFSFGALDIGTSPPRITFGELVMYDTPIVMRIYGDPVFIVEPPEGNARPFQISSKFHRADGSTMFEIRRNEWLTPADHFDVTLVGQRLCIVDDANTKLLVMRVDPPHGIDIETIRMQYKDVTIVGEPGAATTLTMWDLQTSITGAEMVTAEAGIDVTEESITIGTGAAIMHFDQLGGATPKWAGAPPVVGLVPAAATRRKAIDIGRNDPCPCGSGKKWKNCHDSKWT